MRGQQHHISGSVISGAFPHRSFFVAIAARARCPENNETTPLSCRPSCRRTVGWNRVIPPCRESHRWRSFIHRPDRFSSARLPEGTAGVDQTQCALFLASAQPIAPSASQHKQWSKIGSPSFLRRKDLILFRLEVRAAVHVLRATCAGGGPDPSCGPVTAPLVRRHLP